MKYTKIRPISTIYTLSYCKLVLISLFLSSVQLQLQSPAGQAVLYIYKKDTVYTCK